MTMIVNPIERRHNNFSQLTHDYQAHGGAVNTSTTPKVQYGYANGSANTIRQTTLTYPNGRVLTYDYGSTDSISDALSRIGSIVGDDVSSTHLVDYSYLGVGRAAQSVNSPLGQGFVTADYTEPDIKWTLVDLSGSNDPDTGDIYSGLDRFGRVKDNRWYNYGSSADVDRIKYGYDRASNRIWRQNVVADALGKHFDELYTNDFIQRLKDLTRGTLNTNKDGVTDETFAECWSLDQTGNWKKYLQDDDGDGTWDLNQSRTANKVNEITDITETTGPSWVTPANSKAGNMTTIPQAADPTKSYTATYDAWNRLVKIEDDDTSNTVAEYGYDGAKRQNINKTYTGGTLDETRHLYYTQPSQWQIIEERIDSSTDPKQQHIWGLRYIDDCVFRDRDTSVLGSFDERLYGLRDANWNVTAVVGDNGAAEERFAFSGYGRPRFFDGSFTPQSRSEIAWRYLYSGYRWHAETAMFHVRHRGYSPIVGTWLQRDTAPVVSRGTSLYEYCGVLQTPTSVVDPLGRNGMSTTCDWLLDPYSGNLTGCLCTVIGFLDAILVLPYGPWSIALDVLDCICEAGDIMTVYCHSQCNNDYVSFWQFFLELTQGAAGCLFDFLGSVNAGGQLMRLTELIMEIWDEVMATGAYAGGGIPPGILQCLLFLEEHFHRFPSHPGMPGPPGPRPPGYG